MNPVNKASRGDDKAAANCQTSDVGLVLNEKEITLDDGNKKMKRINNFFYGDEVAAKSPTSDIVNFGLVSNATEIKFDDDESKETLDKSDDSIEVMWYPDGNKEIILANEVRLMDRPLMLGDIVIKRYGPKRGQLGYCENVDVHTTIKSLNTNKVLFTSANKLHSKSMLQVGSTVMYDHVWIGEIFDIKHAITFYSVDGSEFTLVDPLIEDFHCLSTNDDFSLEEHVLREFYEGQSLEVDISVIVDSKFHKLSPAMKSQLLKYNADNGTQLVKINVKCLEVFTIEVKWCMTQCNIVHASKDFELPKVITGDDLKKLEILFQKKIRIGDVFSYITANENEPFITLKEWQKQFFNSFNNDPNDAPQLILPKIRFCDKIGHEEVTAMKLSEIGLDSYNCTLNVNSTPKKTKIDTPVVNGRDRNHQRPKKKKIAQKPIVLKPPEKKEGKREKHTVVVLHTLTVADIQWQDGTRDIEIPSIDLHVVRENVFFSDYKRGVFVLKKNTGILGVYGVIQCADKVEYSSSVRVLWFDIDPNNNNLPIPKNINNINTCNLRFHPLYNLKFGTYVLCTYEVPIQFKSLTIGRVLDIGEDGKVSVKWVNGKKSKHWPQELIPIKSGISYPYIISGDNLEVNWIKTAVNKRNKIIYKRDEIEKKFFELLKNGHDGYGLLSKCIHFQNENKDYFENIHKAIKKMIFGFNVSKFFADEKAKLDLELMYRSIMNTVFRIVDDIIDPVPDNEEQTEDFTTSLEKHLLIIIGLINEFLRKIENYETISGFVGSVKMD